MKANVYLFAALLAVAAIPAQAQIQERLNVAEQEEPEFMNSYCLLTSDSTYVPLHKEKGTFKRHKSALEKGLDIAQAGTVFLGKVGDTASDMAESYKGFKKGRKTGAVAGDTGGMVDAVGSLLSVDGQDISLQHPESSLTLPEGINIARIIVKADNNDTDPTDIFRIVRFEAKKKNRIIKWHEASSSVLGDAESDKSGFVYFSGKKYGNQSYLLTTERLAPGEYGILRESLASETSIPIGTFRIASKDNKK